MQLSDLLQRAKLIRAKYQQYETEQYGQPWTTTQIAQGFVGDVGELIKLVMAKDGVRSIDSVDEKLAHELADCLWSLLILSDTYNIDLESAFLNTMDELEAKLN